MSNLLGLRLSSSSVTRSSAVLRFKSRSRVSRGIHKRVELPYPVEGGLGDFLPPEALKVVAIDYQEGLLKRLDEEVRGSPEANESVAQTVLNTASLKSQTLAFNYASLALNNSYFLDQLRPPPTEGDRKTHQFDMSPNLARNIRQQYGTLIQLKSAFSSAVMGLFTNGWVWLVTDRNGRLGVIPTFGPGTLLIRSRTYMAHTKKLSLGRDLELYDSSMPYVHEEWDAQTMGASEADIEADREDDTRILRSPTGSPISPTSPSPSSPVSGVSGGKQPPSPPNALHPRFLSSTTTSCAELKPNNLYTPVQASEDKTRYSYKRETKKKVDSLHLGETLYPLFCIPVYEHAWMAAGYGVWGKEAWLKEFWTVLDWKKISQAYDKVLPADPSLQQ